MALKDVLVYLDQTKSTRVRLRLAIDLAVRNASRLTALCVRETSAAQLDERNTAELGLISAKELDRLDRRRETSIDAVERQLQSELRALACEHGLDAEWRSVDGRASVLVPQHARYADLCILGQASRDINASIGYGFSEQVLFVTGRPVLFVPRIGSFETLGRHVVVAWNSSRAAARSFNDALPLIEHAERTTVLTVNPEEFLTPHNALPTEQLVEHLRRHCYSADLIQIENIPARSIADALQAKARELGDDLLVAGAFGHAMLWEKLLGGATCDLLARMSLPILMSH
jgi:nucleotide-binding universal stress UspA family protein